MLLSLENVLVDTSASSKWPGISQFIFIYSSGTFHSAASGLELIASEIVHVPFESTVSVS